MEPYNKPHLSYEEQLAKIMGPWSLLTPTENSAISASIQGCLSSPAFVAQSFDCRRSLKSRPGVAILISISHQAGFQAHSLTIPYHQITSQ
jgi:hypothetical protein